MDRQREPSMDEAFLNKLREIVLQNISNEDFKLRDLVRQLELADHKYTGDSKKLPENHPFNLLEKYA